MTPLFWEKVVLGMQFRKPAIIEPKPSDRSPPSRA